ncbi:MAG: GGDEF domain-containing protein, partial [Halomonas sp.]
NRRHFDIAFEHQCQRAKQHASQLSVLMLDVDHFKQINDDFGHDAGDAVLVEIALLLRHHLRDMDVICRFGGEEFVALLPATSQITFSCGVATYPDHTQDPKRLLRFADEALYQAKHSGRNRCVVWEETLEAQGFMLGKQQPL